MSALSGNSFHSMGTGNSCLGLGHKVRLGTRGLMANRGPQTSAVFFRDAARPCLERVQLHLLSCVPVCLRAHPSGSAPRCTGTGHFASGAAAPCPPQAQGQGREASSIPPCAGCAVPGRAVVPSPVAASPIQPRPVPLRAGGRRRPSLRPGRAPRTAGGGRGGGGWPRLRVSQ